MDGVASLLQNYPVAAVNLSRESKIFYIQFDLLSPPDHTYVLDIISAQSHGNHR